MPLPPEMTGIKPHVSTCSPERTKRNIYTRHQPDALIPCGECDTTTSEKYLRILDFRHFERFFQFLQSDRKGKKKAISDGVNVSVVLDMVSGNTSK